MNPIITTESWHAFVPRTPGEARQIVKEQNARARLERTRADAAHAARLAEIRRLTAAAQASPRPARPTPVDVVRPTFGPSGYWAERRAQEYAR